MTLSDFEQYLDNMSKPGNWGDGIVLSAAVNFFGRSTIIHTVEGEQLIDASEPFVNSEPMHLGLINGNHYLSVHKAQPPEQLMSTDEFDVNNTEFDNECCDNDGLVDPSKCSTSDQKTSTEHAISSDGKVSMVTLTFNLL
jgi:hypothetical protein